MPRNSSRNSGSSMVRCEFSEGPCATRGENLKKVTSHIFSRNKASGSSVWTMYRCNTVENMICARDRAIMWKLTQCDLLMDSLAVITVASVDWAMPEHSSLCSKQIDLFLFLLWRELWTIYEILSLDIWHLWAHLDASESTSRWNSCTAKPSCLSTPKGKI